MASDSQSDQFPWLPTAERRWASAHQDLLEAIWAAFAAAGDWPDPEQLQRELRARSESVEKVRALRQIPSLLASETGAPREVRLSLFGIGCCRSAQPVLRDLVRAIDVAIERFDDARRPNELSRDDLTDGLKLDGRQADLLGKIILLDPFFLGGGSANVHTWRQSVDQQVLAFEDCRTPEDVLVRLADLRGLLAQTGGIDQPGIRPTARPPLVQRLRDSRWVSPRTRRGIILLGVLAGLIVAAIFAVFDLIPLPDFDGTTETGTDTSASWATDYDGQDPNASGCAKTAENLVSVPIDADRRSIGELVLRGSTACQTAWGRVRRLRNPRQLPVHVNAVRPADGARADFRYNDRPVRIVFGDMLNRTDACVYAEFFLGDEGHQRAYTRTPCRQ